MNALKILFLLPLSIFSLKMVAQVDDLLKNKDITWMAEVYNDFQTSEYHNENTGKDFNKVSLLKFLNTNETFLDEELAFQGKWLRAVAEEKVVCYKDEDCKIENPHWFFGLDTLMIIDPTTYEEKVIVTSCLCNWEGCFLLFRARQIIYYNSKTAQFGLRTLAIAPMEKKWRNGKMVNVPRFWMKVTNLTKKQ